MQMQTNWTQLLSRFLSHLEFVSKSLGSTLLLVCCFLSLLLTLFLFGLVLFCQTGFRWFAWVFASLAPSKACL